MRVGLDARLVGPGLGVAALIRALASGLSSRGIDVVWFGDVELAPDTVSEAVSVPAPGFVGLDSARGHAIATCLRLDLMHFAANSGWWRPGPIPHVLTIHDLMWRSRSVRGRHTRQIVGHGYLRWAAPRAIAGAAAVAVPSATTAAAVLAGYGARAEVIPNGVSDRWREPPNDVIGDGAPYVVAFAGRDPRKATEISLEAWARVADRGVRLVLLAGGGVPPGLKDRIAELGAGGRIELLPYLQPARLTGIVAGALALLYPSRDEGFGLPVAEAMAAGVPVITGLAAVTVEVGGDAILRIGPEDPVAAAAAHLHRLLDDADLRDRLATRGRARVAGLTWTAAVDRYCALYERVAG